MQTDVASTDALVGISIEPIDAVRAQVAAAPNNALALVARDPLTDPAYLAQRVLKNLFNFLSSFDSMGNAVVVKLAELERWYEKFVQKIKNEGVGFLERFE